MPHGLPSQWTCPLACGHHSSFRATNLQDMRHVPLDQGTYCPSARSLCPGLDMLPRVSYKRLDMCLDGLSVSQGYAGTTAGQR